MNYKKNAHFYNFEERNYETSLFENIDATYILHLEGNNRLGHVEEQLTKYIPSKKIFIVYNKGFKKCTKDLSMQCSTYDMIDANLNIIDHSIANNYSNILILEDDFQFNSSILEDEHKKDIDDWLNKNNNSEFLYYLGSLPIIKTFNLSNHNQLFLSIGTHALIISKNMKEKLLLHKEYAKDWDIYLNQFFLYKTMRTYIGEMCLSVRVSRKASPCSVLHFLTDSTFWAPFSIHVGNKYLFYNSSRHVGCCLESRSPSTREPCTVNYGLCNEFITPPIPKEQIDLKISEDQFNVQQRNK